MIGDSRIPLDRSGVLPRSRSAASIVGIRPEAFEDAEFSDRRDLPQIEVAGRGARGARLRCLRLLPGSTPSRSSSRTRSSDDADDDGTLLADTRSQRSSPRASTRARKPGSGKRIGSRSIRHGCTSSRRRPARACWTRRLAALASQLIRHPEYTRRRLSARLSVCGPRSCPRRARRRAPRRAGRSTASPTTRRSGSTYRAGIAGGALRPALGDLLVPRARRPCPNDWRGSRVDLLWDSAQRGDALAATAGPCRA